MKSNWKRTAILVLVISALAGIADAVASEKNETPKRLATGVEEQSAVALTIYNVNLGLVKDQRQATLPAGTFELRFMDVASQIIPASVQVRSLTGPSSLRVLEQNYEYDLLNPQRLLEKYVGKEVKLYTEYQYTERDETVTATLLSVALLVALARATRTQAALWKGDVPLFSHALRLDPGDWASMNRRRPCTRCG